MTSEATLDIGEVVGDRFRVLSYVGAGGFGEVYAAYDRLARERVALKLFFIHGDRSVSVRQRYALARHEINVLRLLDLPQVPRFIAAGVYDNRSYLAMEYIAGERLDRYLADNARHYHPLDLADQLCEIVRGFHRRHQLILDIKPENIIIEADGRLRLIDVGGVRPLGVALPHLPLTGTEGYAAPEQLAGGALDERSDIYALAVTIDAIVGAPETSHFALVLRRASAPNRLRRYSSVDVLRGELRRAVCDDRRVRTLRRRRRALRRRACEQLGQLLLLIPLVLLLLALGCR